MSEKTMGGKVDEAEWGGEGGDVETGMKGRAEFSHFGRV